MRRTPRFLLSLLLAMPLLVAPTATLAAPTVTITPVRDVAGTTRVIAITGLAPNQEVCLEVRLFLGFFGAETLANVSGKADAAGNLTADLGTTGLPRGRYKVILCEKASQSPLGEASFEVIPPPTVPGLVIQPDSGAAGTPFALIGERFPLNSQLTIRLGEAGGIPFATFPTTTDGAGAFSLTINSAGFTPGFGYAVTAFPAGVADAAPLADRAYFDLSGSRGTPPGGPRVELGQPVYPQNPLIDIEAHIFGLAANEQARWGIARDVISPGPGGYQFVIPLTTFQVDGSGRATVQAESGDIPPGNYLFVVGSPAGSNTPDLLSIASHGTILATFTVIQPPTITIRAPAPIASPSSSPAAPAPSPRPSAAPPAPPGPSAAPLPPAPTATRIPPKPSAVPGMPNTGRGGGGSSGAAVLLALLGLGAAGLGTAALRRRHRPNR